MNLGSTSSELKNKQKNIHYFYRRWRPNLTQVLKVIFCIQFPSQLPVLEERKATSHSPHRIWTRGNSHNHEETLVSKALYLPRWTNWWLFLSLAAFCFSGGNHCKPFYPQYLTSLLYSPPPLAALPHPLPCPSMQAQANRDAKERPT